MGLLILLAALLGWPLAAEAHTHAQCLASKPCRDAIAAAVAAAEAALGPKPKPCDILITHGTQIFWAGAVGSPGVSICLPDGEHAFVVKPPRGLAGVTIRALNYGKATVQGIELLENAVNVWGLRVPCEQCPGGSAIWTRTVAP
jgi:hypothetical protein